MAQHQTLAGKMTRLAICLLSLISLFGPSLSAAMLVTESDREFLGQVRDAVRRKDTEWIVSHSALPMVALSAGQQHPLKTEEYRHLVNAVLTEAFTVTFSSEAKKEPFKNYRGVMIGDGLLWFERVKRHESDPWEYRITAFGGFAFQPSAEEANQAPEPTS